ncbi:hypothetical protein SAMN05216201_111127 [Pseudomonas linyingensis]|uniref:HupE / UreJ protein n=1 Tax=Pseudomonas linyingensis TaxID=915471 RepID=A0A1H7AAI2_9PSED|nr:hypothetical protein [Pseudomonas linyingensis]SEJ59092.1 hypothetical protein SAMN05216201_111127 [Pseudomonas linyingensis]
MKKILSLALMLSSLPAFAHVGHAHTSEHGILHHLLGTDQMVMGIAIVLVAGLAYWLRPRW